METAGKTTLPNRTNMDVGTITGFIIGGILIFCVAVFGGYETLVFFWNTPSMLIVFGGIAVTLFIAFPLKSIRNAFRAVRKCFVTPNSDPQQVIDQIVSFAGSARRTGLLAQESAVDNVRDPFLAEGLHMVIDGLPPATVENILTSEIGAMQQRHQQSQNIALHCGRCAPAFGMIGTLIGLVLMLTNLEAETVGPGMAVALLTTLYGILAAQLIFLPIAEKLKQLHEAEMQIKSMIIQGVLALQGGEHPRIIRQKLLTFFPSGERSDEPRERFVPVQDAPITLPMEEEDEATKLAA